MGFSYKDAGVDIDAGNKAVAMIKNDVESTFGPGVLTGLGSFGGLFALDLKDIKEPVLVSGTDGVGTKLKLAFQLNKHDTVGIDLVAMCVNDILAQGAKPLFFLDYLATGKLNPERVAEIVSGISQGCQQASCSLIGGETAELPGFYQPGEYDLAGFAVGLVDRDKIITGENIQPGDQLIGLSSNGLHSNGFSLIRKVLFEHGQYQADDCLPGLSGNLGEVLLKPTRIYVEVVMELIKKFRVKGIAHITGGGLLENVPRILPEQCRVVIKQDSWSVQEIFKIIQRLGEITDTEMYRTLNMGIGLVIVVPAEEVDQCLQAATKAGEKAYHIGEVLQGDKAVALV